MFLLSFAFLLLGMVVEWGARILELPRPPCEVVNLWAGAVSQSVRSTLDDTADGKLVSSNEVSTIGHWKVDFLLLAGN